MSGIFDMYSPELREMLSQLEEDDLDDAFGDDDETDPEWESEERIMLSEQKSMPMATPERADKYARKVMSLCRHIILHHYIKVFKNTLYVYSTDTGHYQRKEKPDNLVFIESCFVGSDRTNLTNKVIEEVLNKLLRTPELQLESDDFNVDVTEINCLNGIVKIGGDGIELLPHTPNKLFSYCISAKYIQDQSQICCPSFENFCNTSLDGASDKRTLMLETFGYLCSDSNAAKAGIFYKGAPNSGKSVCLDVVSTMLGYESVVSIHIHNLADRFNRAELFGKKANIQGEMKSNKLSDISIFKAITGGDRLMGEYKGKNPFYFIPKCKLLFAGNVLPGTREVEATAAFRNRIVPLLFNKSIPTKEQDKSLKQKLLAEIDSIFTHSLIELDKLHKNNYRFTLPEESVRFLEAYSAVESSVKTFINERCRLSPAERVFNKELLAAYEKYCLANGLEMYGKQKFFTILDNTSGLTRRRIRRNGENLWGYIGIGIKTGTK
jgi:putative DNA primase/helicase